MRPIRARHRRPGVVREAASALVVGAVVCGLVALGYSRWAGRDLGGEPGPGSPPLTAVVPTAQALPPADPEGPVAEKKYNVNELRRRYPYESLAGRLEYEVGHPDAGPRPAPLPEETDKRLQTWEESLTFQDRWHPRAKSLAQLHSDEVEAFIGADGFGVSRMLGPSPSPRYLELVEAPPVPFASLKEVSPTEDANILLPVPRDGVAGADPDRPTWGLLEIFHSGSRGNFLHPAGFGHVKDRDHVAGFVPHRFTSIPELARSPARDPKAAPEKAKWLVRRLELVSLLKHEKPAVYVSEHLPRMDELKRVKTRPLSSFEDRALQALKEGEDLVARANATHIHLLGSLRAAKQCLACHYASRGDLLGAFSYDLQRARPEP
jgi:hypothetical protein